MVKKLPLFDGYLMNWAFMSLWGVVTHIPACSVHPQKLAP